MRPTSNMGGGRRKSHYSTNKRKSTTPSKQQKGETPSRGGASSSNRKSAPTPQNATMDVSRRTRRFKRGVKALKEIRALQRTTHLLIPKASFCRLVKETMNQFSYHEMRIQSSALEALQEAAEMYMVQFFEDSLLCALHAKRVTLMVHDCHLMRRLRGPSEVANR